ncbi:MAG TPA: DNA-binding response regulator [Rhodospirillaceae bacterium]|nr:DNA-binding response regulator [Rhodospirillaceae bacterium]
MSEPEKTRILFVDDEPHVLDAMKRSLRTRQAVWDMTFHSSPSLALKAHQQKAYDVAVVDMRMPEMSGLQLIAALRAAGPQIQAIVVTGAADLETALAAINEANVFRFYTKPCQSEVLAAGIEQALELNQKPAALPTTDAAFGLATLNRLPTGVVVVDSQLHVLFMNSQGAAYLTANDGIGMSPAGLCLASRQSEASELRLLVKSATSSGANAQPRAISLSRQGDERPLSVVVAPLPAGPAGPPSAILLINDPERLPFPTVDTVMRLFELTDAEAKLALRLGRGERLEEAAPHLGITVNSARTYLKRIFSKTGVTRQAELVRLIMAAPTLCDLGITATPKQTHSLVQKDRAH